MAGKKITVIQPTKPLHSTEHQSLVKRRRVAAYARVSTDKEEQETAIATMQTSGCVNF